MVITQQKRLMQSLCVEEVSADCSVIETGIRHVPLLLSSFEVLTVKAVKGWKMSKIFCRSGCLAEVQKKKVWVLESCVSLLEGGAGYRDTNGNWSWN